jgi:hypothetical protein
MAGAAGPNTAEAGLVFAYDTGNTVTSYIGEPTTNQFTNPDFSSGTTGWTFGSWDGGRYTYTTETILGPFGKPVPALKVVRTTSDTSYAHFHQYNGGKYTNGNTYTLSAYVKGAGTLAQYTQGGYSPITYIPEQFVTLTDEWQRISYTLTSQTDTLYPYWAAENITQNVPMYFTFAQSEQKNHRTQFVNGTRSATQSLLNLTGNGVINVTNASFDSNAQLVFDGTNDTIFTADSTYLNPGSSDFSIEVLFNCSNASVGEGILYNKEDLYETAIHSGYFQYAWQPHWAWDGESSFPVSSNTWYHAVVTYDKSYQRMYKNGVEVYNRAQSGNMGTNSVVLSMGARGVDSGGNSGYNFFPGQIPVVKVYKKALTANEVATNFQALRYRFGI